VNDVPVLPVAEALACERARLRAARLGFWCWQPAHEAVVLGANGDPARELRLDAVRADGLAVHTRRSGGGAVYLGPGVVCFGLLLGPRRSLCDPRGLAREVLPVLARGLAALGAPARLQGLGDLAVDGRKVVGTAQRWTRRAVLLHGSVLVDADLDRLSRYLRHPPREPAYRAGRAHGAFCTTLAALLAHPPAAADVAHALARACARLHS